MMWLDKNPPFRLAGKQRQETSTLIQILQITHPAEVLLRHGAPEHTRAPVDVIDWAHQIATRREIHHPPQKLLKHTDNDSVDWPLSAAALLHLWLPPPPPPPLAGDVHAYRPKLHDER